MQMEYKLRVPVVGMWVVVKKANCVNCGPSMLAKGDGGKIIEIGKNCLEFKIKDWADREYNYCVQCCNELRDVTKEDWIEMCDAEQKRKPKQGKIDQKEK